MSKCFKDPEPEEHVGEDRLYRFSVRLRGNDFVLWGRAFKGLLEFGVENEKALVKILQERPSASRVDAVYTEILLRLCGFYNRKRKTTSEYRFKKYYDVKEFCY